MKTFPLARHLPGVFMMLALLGATAAHAQTKTSGFEAYKLVQTRNIFDPDRRALASHWGSNAPSSGGSISSRRSEYSAPRRNSDYIALTGILVTEDKSLAFFGGSRPDYDKVLTVKNLVAGATITKITAANIEVQRDGKSIVVAIGQTVPFDNSAPAPAPVPVAATAPPLSDSPAPSSGGSITPNSPPAAPSAPGSMSDVMKRMMERRQQQLK
jgi:hypothetical protein